MPRPGTPSWRSRASRSRFSRITRDDVCHYDALLIKRNPVPADLLDAGAPGELRLRLLARNGVGFDHIHVEASTRAGVMACTTPDAVARPLDQYHPRNRWACLLP